MQMLKAKIWVPTKPDRMHHERQLTRQVWIYRFVAVPHGWLWFFETTEAAAVPGCGCWSGPGVGAQVASQHCPILRSGRDQCISMRVKRLLTAGSALRYGAGPCPAQSIRRPCGPGAALHVQGSGN